MTKEAAVCRECGCSHVSVLYKGGLEELCPFPPGQLSHTACLLCDPWLRATIKGLQGTGAPKLMTAAEQAEKAKDERAANRPQNTEEPKKPKKKKKGNTGAGLMTDQERMNAFMQNQLG
jgi:hypothetical protein